MTITPHLFEAYLKCPTKCWLRSIGEPTAGNAYAEWVKTQNESYRAEAAKRLTADLPTGECEPSSRSSRGNEAQTSTENLKTSKWRMALDVEVVAQASSQASSGSVSLPEQKPGETPVQIGRAHV